MIEGRKGRNPVKGAEPGSSQDKDWEVLEAREVYVARPWLEVTSQTVQLPDGRVVGDYHQIRLGEYAIVYAQTTEGKVLVERLYKHGIGRVTLALPAGAVDPGRAPKGNCWRRPGYQDEYWTPLGHFAGNGNYGCGRAHIFRAEGAHRVAEPNSGDLEAIEVLLMDPLKT